MIGHQGSILALNQKGMALELVLMTMFMHWLSSAHHYLDCWWGLFIVAYDIILLISFSPIFILLGMVGMMGAAALTKKRGGYTNTKLHGIMAWVGMMIAGGGLYVIYQNKESMGKNHFTTYHSWGKWSVISFTLSRSMYTMKLFLICSIQSTLQHILNNYWNVIYTKIKAGLGALGGCVLPGIAGAVFLHPDFGIDKQNKLFRKVHKYASRALLMLAWCATISGLKTLVGDDIKPLIMFAAPLVIAAPFTLM